MEADKVVVAVSGNACTSVGNGLAGCDALYEQLLPEEALASAYIACPTLTLPFGCEESACAPNIFRYIATQDDTTVALDGSVTSEAFTLDQGGFFEFLTADPHIVSSNKPLYVFQYLISRESGFPVAENGDPAMTQLIPVDQFLDDYTFLTVPGSGPNFLNVVAPVGVSLVLDVTAVTEECITVGTFGGTEYCCVIISIGEGTHTMSGDLNFGVLVSGFIINGLYAYVGGAGFTQSNSSG